MCENLIRYLFGKISMFRAMCPEKLASLKDLANNAVVVVEH